MTPIWYLFDGIVCFPDTRRNECKNGEIFGGKSILPRKDLQASPISGRSGPLVFWRVYG